jgi:uncharacterized protein YbgA (DUF1722 family)
MGHFPLLPVEEEARLHDRHVRENFVERVFCHHRWLRFRKERFSARRLREFHQRHKYILLARSQRHWSELDRVVAQAGGRRSGMEVAGRYAMGFFQALKQIPTVKKHVNLLQHISGFFKEDLDASDREELRGEIERYRRGLVPRLVPQTLIRHHSRRLGLRHIEEQVYLSSHPMLQYDS